MGAKQSAIDYLSDVAPKDKKKGMSAVDFLSDVTPTKKTEETITAEPSMLDQAKRYGGLGERAVLEGVAGIPGGVYNFASTVSNLPSLVQGKEIPAINEWGVPRSIDTQQYGTKLADYLGLTQPTEAEQKPMEYARLASGLATGGLGVKALGGAIPAGIRMISGANAPVVNVVGGLGGKAGGEIAGGMVDDSSPILKTLATIAGGIVGGGGSSSLASMVKPTSRAALRTVQSSFGALEPLAGRLLNRQAGSEADTVAGLLETGGVQGVKPIAGFQPKTSDIAGNAGISSLARFVENSNMAGTDLGTRQFQNAKAIKESLGKAVGTKAEKADAQAFLDKLNNEYTQEMRARNVPTDVSSINNVFDNAIKTHNGNPSITNGLEALQKQFNAALAKDPDAGFNTILNFKQNIDAQLRANPLADPIAAAVQKSAKELKGLKSELTKVLTNAEPDYRDIAQQQAIGIKHQSKQKALSDLLNKATNSIPLVTNASGIQEELLPLSASMMSEQVNNPKLMSKLSPYQQEQYKNATQAALSGGRGSMGMARASNTMQNAKMEQLISDDVIRAFSGSDVKNQPGVLSNILRPATKGLSNVTGRTGEIADILAKAELDPQYAAMLMRKYKLSPNIDMKSAAGRNALYGALTQYQNK
jgi:hypothetical protein